ncbi:MAG: hypothetical protein GXO02_00160 [Epsilonproteobacteria bacterium]|nr:hypothetical protein [Campylobacterota bacterium]
MRFKIAILSLFVIFMGLDAKIFKRYPVKSAMIFYDVKTSSVAKGLNNQVRGIAKLVFDNWGAREVKEEISTEIQTGDFNETRKRHFLSKIDFGTIYTVDFDENVTYKTRDRDMDIAIMNGEDWSNEPIEILKRMKAKKVGEEMVAGVKCEKWELKDQSICLYKGMPIKIVVRGPGFETSRTAIQVIIDKPVPEKEFELPNFPIVVDEAYTNNKAALVRANDYIASIRDLQKAMKAQGIDLSSGNVTITPEMEKEMINILGARYLKKQKKYLPLLVKELPKAIDCIKKANSKEEAQKCIVTINKINERLGDQTREFDYEKWDDKKKEKIINSLENELANTKVTLECVKKYDKTTDVIICTEGSLNPKD